MPFCNRHEMLPTAVLEHVPLLEAATCDPTGVMMHQNVFQDFWQDCHTTPWSIIRP